MGYRGEDIFEGDTGVTGSTVPPGEGGDHELSPSTSATPSPTDDAGALPGVEVDAKKYGTGRPRRIIIKARVKDDSGG